MIQFYDKLTCFLCRFRHGKTSRRAQQNFLTSGNFRGDVRKEISRRAEKKFPTCGNFRGDVRKFLRLRSADF